MAIDPRIEQTLRGPQPLKDLRELAVALQSSNQAHASILELLEQARIELSQQGRDADEDAILELMDFLVGWCSPHMSLKRGE